MQCTCQENIRKRVNNIETLKLIWKIAGKDEDGFPEEEQHEVDAYYEEKSVTRQEAYESMRAGIKVEAIFEIRQEDWEETRHSVDGHIEYAREVEHDGRAYEIKRTYKKGKSKIEVICG